MPVSRARHLSAVVTACAALLLCAGAAQTADDLGDDFYIYPGGVRGPAPTDDSGSSGGLGVGRPSVLAHYAAIIGQGIIRR